MNRPGMMLPKGGMQIAHELPGFTGGLCHRRRSHCPDSRDDSSRQLQLAHDPPLLRLKRY
jgi:hypothetical protein